MLKDATTIVGLHSSTRWLRSAGERVAISGKDLEEDFAERRSAELADIVWSPGQYMLDWVRQHGWDVRGNCHVQPYVAPLPQEAPKRDHPSYSPIRENSSSSAARSFGRAFSSFSTRSIAWCGLAMSARSKT